MDGSMTVARRSRWVAMAPLLCAAHCLATPLLAATAPFLAATPTLEWTALGLTCGVGVWLVAKGVAQHGGSGLWLVLAAGVALWGMSLGELLEPLPEAATTAAGSLIVAATLWWNARRSHHLEASCACGACAAEPLAEATPARQVVRQRVMQRS